MCNYLSMIRDRQIRRWEGGGGVVSVDERINVKARGVGVVGGGRFPPPQQPNRPTAVCLTGLPSTFPCRKSLNIILSKETFWNLEGLTVILPFFCSPMKLQ